MPTLSIFPFTDNDGDPVTTPGLSSALWEGVLYQAAKADPRYGNVQEYNLENLGADEFTVSALGAAASEGFAKLDAAGGKYSLVATTDADGEGAQVQIPAACSIKPENGLVVIEFAIDLFRCSTFFVGLSETNVDTLDGSGDLPVDVDHIGFHRKDGGVVNFVSFNNESTDVSDTVQVLAADYYQKLQAGETTPTRLGFAIDARNKIRAIVVDGVPYRTAAEAIDPDSIPNEPMTITLAIERGAAQDEADVRLDVNSIKLYYRD